MSDPSSVLHSPSLDMSLSSLPLSTLTPLPPLSSSTTTAAATLALLVPPSSILSTMPPPQPPPFITLDPNHRLPPPPQLPIPLASHPSHSFLESTHLFPSFFDPTQNGVPPPPQPPLLSPSAASAASANASSSSAAVVVSATSVSSHSSLPSPPPLASHPLSLLSSDSSPAPFSGVDPSVAKFLYMNRSLSTRLTAYGCNFPGCKFFHSPHWRNRSNAIRHILCTHVNPTVKICEECGKEFQGHSYSAHIAGHKRLQNKKRKREEQEKEGKKPAVIAVDNGGIDTPNLENDKISADCMTASDSSAESASTANSAAPFPSTITVATEQSSGVVVGLHVNTSIQHLPAATNASLVQKEVLSENAQQDSQHKNEPNRKLEMANKMQEEENAEKVNEREEEKNENCASDPSKVGEWWTSHYDTLLQLFKSRKAALPPSECSLTLSVYSMSHLRHQILSPLISSLSAVAQFFFCPPLSDSPVLIQALANFSPAVALTCNSLSRLLAIKRLGPLFPSSRIRFFAPFASRADYSIAFQHSDWVVVDNVWCLQKWTEAFQNHSICLKFHLDRKDAALQASRDGEQLPEWNVGMRADELESAAQICKKANIQVIGLDLHAARDFLDGSNDIVQMTSFLDKFIHTFPNCRRIHLGLLTTPSSQHDWKKVNDQLLALTKRSSHKLKATSAAASDGSSPAGSAFECVNSDSHAHDNCMEITAEFHNDLLAAAGVVLCEVTQLKSTGSKSKFIGVSCQHTILNHYRNISRDNSAIFNLSTLASIGSHSQLIGQMDRNTLMQMDTNDDSSCNTSKVADSAKFPKDCEEGDVLLLDAMGGYDGEMSSARRRLVLETEVAADESLPALE